MACHGLETVYYISTIFTIHYTLVLSNKKKAQLCTLELNSRKIKAEMMKTRAAKQLMVLCCFPNDRRLRAADVKRFLFHLSSHTRRNGINPTKHFFFFPESSAPYSQHGTKKIKIKIKREGGKKNPKQSAMFLLLRRGFFTGL